MGPCTDRLPPWCRGPRSARLFPNVTVEVSGGPLVPLHRAPKPEWLKVWESSWYQQRQQWWDANRKRYRPTVWALVDRLAEAGAPSPAPVAIHAENRPQSMPFALPSDTSRVPFARSLHHCPTRMSLHANSHLALFLWR